MNLTNRNREYEKPSQNEVDAIARVQNTPELAKHEDVIFYDWSRWEDHMDWIAHAPVAEIVSWCEAVDVDEEVAV